MSLLNLFSDNEYFRATSLYDRLKQKSVGFVDIGASKGVHSLIQPIASLSNCLSFEPNEAAYEEIIQNSSEKIFSNIIILNNAIFNMNGQADFYITKNDVCCSLVKTDKHFIKRYSVPGLKIIDKKSVNVRTLDSVVHEVSELYENPAEIIKLDCQGTEYEILKCASKTLQEKCVAILCEVGFIPVYENQKMFCDVNQLLMVSGFSLCGLYPHYISAKKLNRINFDTEEQLLWADALYIKDPLSPLNEHFTPSQRFIDILIVSCLLFNYFDLSLQYIQTYIEKEEDRQDLFNLVEFLASNRKKDIEQNAKKLITEINNMDDKTYLYAKKFIDQNKGHNDVDLLSI